MFYLVVVGGVGGYVGVIYFVLVFVDDGYVVFFGGI